MLVMIEMIKVGRKQDEICIVMSFLDSFILPMPRQEGLK
jgi:hypothetical protein